MSDHDGAREALGAYVLGSLDGAERARVDAHLTGCSACRDELASLAALPGLMSRLSAEEVLADLLAPPGSLLPRTLAAVEQERASGQQRLRRWRGTALAVSALATAAALAAVLVLPGAVSSSGGGQQTTAAGRPLVAVQPGAAGGRPAGRAQLETRPWGTQLHLVLHDLPRQGTFTAWVVDARGTRAPAATWRATPNGSAEVTGASALDPAALVRLDVLSDDGTSVLTTTT